MSPHWAWVFIAGNFSQVFMTMQSAISPQTIGRGLGYHWRITVNHMRENKTRNDSQRWIVHLNGPWKRIPMILYSEISVDQNTLKNADFRKLRHYWYHQRSSGYRGSTFALDLCLLQWDPSPWDSPRSIHLVDYHGYEPLTFVHRYKLYPMNLLSNMLLVTNTSRDDLEKQ